MKAYFLHVLLTLFFLNRIHSSEHENELDKYKRLLSSSQDLIHEMQVRIQNLEASVQQITRNTQPKASIGFLATLPHKMTSLPQHSVVIFNYIVTNDGGAYDTSTGIFTCLYNFSWTTLTDPGSMFHTEFSVNNVVITRSHNNAQGVHESKSATQNVVVHLRHGDKVWIKTMDKYGEMIHGDSFSSFSGFKV